MRRTAPRASVSSQGPKVTDYFARKPAGDPPTSARTKDPPSSEPRNSGTIKSKPVATPDSEREVISVSSDSHISISSSSVIFVSKSSKGPRTRFRAAASAQDTSPPCIKQRASAATRVSDASPPLPSTKAAQILKPYIVSQSSPSKPNNVAKRKKKFDTDSDVEYLDNTIYVPRVVSSKVVSATPVLQVSASPSPRRTSGPEKDSPKPKRVRTPPKKKQRLSAPETRAAAVVDLVPSSQSDEQGLVEPLKPARKTADEVSDIVSRWREATLIPSDDVPLAATEPPSVGIDTEVYSPPVPELDVDMPTTEESGPSSQALPDVAASNGDAVKIFMSCPGTPQQPDASQIESGINLSFPATPVALDAESKTAQIIAQIKAKAFQARYSSPENDPLSEIPDLQDSSDESEHGFALYRPSNVTNADRLALL